MFVLESFQAGLSWITILRRRKGFLRHFMGLIQITLPRGGKLKWEISFSILGSYAIAERLRRHLGMPKLGKIWSAEKGFPTCCGGGVGGRPVRNNWHHLRDVPALTLISLKLSADLKAVGFRFCGPKTAYAFMQAAGLVNDHLVSCPTHAKVARLAGAVIG